MLQGASGSHGGGAWGSHGGGAWGSHGQGALGWGIPSAGQFPAILNIVVNSVCWVVGEEQRRPAADCPIRSTGVISQVSFPA